MEAEFFFRKMESSTSNVLEFPCFTSAFLSALRSCTEHNRLHSRDPRFKAWYEKLKSTHLNHGCLYRLGKLRDVEVHQKGNLTFGGIRFELPPGVTVDARNLRFSGDRGELIAQYLT